MGDKKQSPFPPAGLWTLSDQAKASMRAVASPRRHKYATAKAGSYART